jgi:hypothetical protein
VRTARTGSGAASGREQPVAIDNAVSAAQSKGRDEARIMGGLEALALWMRNACTAAWGRGSLVWRYY